MLPMVGPDDMLPILPTNDAPPTPALIARAGPRSTCVGGDFPGGDIEVCKDDGGVCILLFLLLHLLLSLAPYFSSSLELPSS